MTRVLSGAALILLSIAVVWFASDAVFEAVAVAALFAATEELIAIFAAGGITVLHVPAIGAAVLTLLSFSGVVGERALPVEFALIVGFLALALVAMGSWRGGADALTTISASLFPSLYLSLPIGAIIAIRESAGPEPLFLLMLTVIVSDTAQYYTGRLTGRRPLAPTISPKKTLEGALGGVVFGTAVFAAVGAWWLPIVPVSMRILLGVAIVSIGIAGDLFESMLKRGVAVKDSSSIIPGHGGVLDRIDALLFAAPFFYLVGRFLVV